MSRAARWTPAFAGVTAFFLAFGAAAQTTPSSPSQPPKWGAHLDLEGKIGNQRNLGEGDLFVPLLQDGKSMLFANIKARMDDSTSTEGNFGAGVRHMFDAGFNLGAYGFFDRRKATYGSYFNQVTLGAEVLSTDWDLRANYYIPEGRRSHQVDSLNTASLEGTTVVFRGGEERSLTGFDGEIGYRVPVYRAEENTQWRLFAGAYRFYADQVAPVQGPRLRTELTFDEIPWLWEGSRLTWGGEFQDDVRGKTGFVTARLRIPLQVFGEGRKVASLTPLERRMTDPVIRDIDVVSRSGAFGAPETATQTASGGTLSVLSTATTTGANLPTAITNAGANSTVILSGAFTTTAGAGGIVTLAAGQTVMGNGSVTVRSPSGRTAVLTTSTGASITANVSGANYSIVMANNSTLQGMTISNTDGSGNNAQGVEVSGVSNVRIIDNVINATASGGSTAHGIDVTGGSTNVTISGNRITTSNTTSVGLGIQVNGAGSSATISGNTITMSATSASSMTGVTILTNATNTTVSGNTINISSSGTGTTTTGISVANSTATLTGNSGTLSGSATATANAMGVTVNAISANIATVTATGNTFTATASATRTGGGAADTVQATARGLFVQGASTVTGSSNGFTLSATGSSDTSGATTVIARGLDATGGTTTFSGNTVSATGNGTNTGGGALTVSSDGVRVNNATATVSSNTLSASGGGTNSAANLTNATINAGSTGNTANAGICTNGGGNTGTISFTGTITSCP